MERYESKISFQKELKLLFNNMLDANPILKLNRDLKTKGNTHFFQKVTIYPFTIKFLKYFGLLTFNGYYSRADTF
jgi:hypothetical protein